MLVAVSDLHWRDEAAWTTDPVMTEGFLVKSLIPQVRDAMRSVTDPARRELEVLFLGDLVDINRSRYWVDGSSKDDPTGVVYKPWSDWCSPAPGLEARVVTVLQKIVATNEKNVRLWLTLKHLDHE